jgi:hypothetical protein
MLKVQNIDEQNQWILVDAEMVQPSVTTSRFTALELELLPLGPFKLQASSASLMNAFSVLHWQCIYLYWCHIFYKFVMQTFVCYLPMTSRNCVSGIAAGYALRSSRVFVFCSYAYAKPMSSYSLHAVPRKASPKGAPGAGQTVFGPAG